MNNRHYHAAPCTLCGKQTAVKAGGTAVCPECAMEDDRIDSIGQNGNEGSHYAESALAQAFECQQEGRMQYNQSREVAEETGCCADGYPCGESDIDGEPLYCDGCPNNTEADPTNPGHYRAGKVECIDALESATVNKTGIEAVCTANAIKYLWRYESKGGAEDVRKARWYIERLLKALEEAQ